MPEITYAQALRDALREEMIRDPNVFLMGEDIGVYGGAFAVTKGLLQEFGEERVRDTPISEAVIAGAAAGAAMTGLRPVAEIMFMDFTTIAMDQIVNQAAKVKYMFGGKAKVPMVLRTPAGAGTGAAGQHSQSLEAWFAHVPGLKVVMPSTPHDAKGLLKTAIRDDGPVIFVEHKLLYKMKGEVPDGDYTVPFGKADIKRAGKHLTIIALSHTVVKALQAAEELAKEGIEAEVVDPRTLVPLDEDTLIESVKKTGRAIVVHEAVRRAGFGAEIAAMLTERAFDYLDAPVVRLGGKDCPIPYNRVLEASVIPQKDDIVKAARAMVKG
jgi:pyruvate dehydrogenase E1 component beta subunit